MKRLIHLQYESYGSCVKIHIFYSFWNYAICYINTKNRGIANKNGERGGCVPATVELFFVPKETWESGEVGGCTCSPAANIESQWTTLEINFLKYATNISTIGLNNVSVCLVSQWEIPELILSHVKRDFSANIDVWLLWGKIDFVSKLQYD